MLWPAVKMTDMVIGLDFHAPSIEAAQASAEKQATIARLKAELAPKVLQGAQRGALHLTGPCGEEQPDQEGQLERQEERIHRAQVDQAPPLGQVRLDDLEQPLHAAGLEDVN